MATEAETHAAGPAATNASIAVEPHGGPAHGDAHGGGHGGGPIQFAWPMFFWFLAVFLVAFAILKKFAWGPILAGLDKRETDIRQSLENAERIRAELARLDGTCQQRLAEADQKAKESPRTGAQGRPRGRPRDRVQGQGRGADPGGKRPPRDQLLHAAGPGLPPQGGRRHRRRAGREDLG
jgi:hypothetical protein